MVQPNKIDFKNTTAVFSHLGNATLVSQIAMFYGMSKPLLNTFAKIIMRHSAIGFFGVNKMIKKKVFKHFCGGETVDEGLISVKQLFRQNILTILDYSAEGEETETFFDQTTAEVLKTIEASSSNPGIGTAVFKITGIARMELLEKVSSGTRLTSEETEAYERVKKRVLLMCKTAYEKKLPILIDAEHSWVQQSIDDIAESMMEIFNKNKAIVYNTYQFYRQDRLSFLQKSLDRAQAKSYQLGVKLVRGAYLEKENERAQAMGYPSPIYPNKQLTDRAFNNAVELCIRRLDNCSICVGTHNETSCAVLVHLMETYGVALTDERVLIAQLKGMSDHISRTMANIGIRTCKYVPYGPLVKVIPYLLRRIEENKAVAGEASRELHIRIAELKSRLRFFIDRFKNHHYGSKSKGKFFRKSIF